MKFSLHEKMMRTHGTISPNQKGMPRDIVSYEITFKGKKQIADGTFLFIFEKPEAFTYKAGQHARITLINSPETDDEGNSRFLSFASTPDERDITFAMRMRDTAFKRVLGKMQIGEKVLMQMRLHSPHGSFALQDAADAKRPAVFLIGGIGIVPVFSMIKDAIKEKQQHKIFLFYSNRRPEDAPFLSDLQKLAKENPSTFELIPIMTQPEKAATIWKGETGYITKALIEKYVKNLYSPIYFVAGLTEMVNAMQKLLKDAGVDGKNIRAEEFGAFTMAHGANKKRSWKHDIWLFTIILLICIAVILHIIGIAIPHIILNILLILLLLKIAILITLKFKQSHAKQMLLTGGK